MRSSFCIRLTILLLLVEQAWVRAIDHRRSKGHAYVVFASPECKQYLQDRARLRLLWFQGRYLRVDEPRGKVTKSLAAALAVGFTEALRCRQLQLCTQWPQEVQHMTSLIRSASLCHCQASQLRSSVHCVHVAALRALQLTVLWSASDDITVDIDPTHRCIEVFFRRSK
jgi:hypothetical protein